MLPIDRRTKTGAKTLALPGTIGRSNWIVQALAACVLLLIFSGTAHAQTVNLAWNANTESDLAGYRIYYGTTSGVYTNNIDVGLVTTYTVGGLTVGQPYYFAVKAYNATGVESVNYSNEVSSANPLSAQITAPVPGTTLVGSTVTFQWASTGVPSYQLTVGTTPGSGNIFDQVVGTNLSAAVSGLPTNGSPVYVRLWSLIGSVWYFRDYSYTAFLQPPSLSINDVSLTEGNSGTKTATFTVTLAPTSTQSVTVAYATANGTATSGSDYVAKTGTLTFAAGVSTQTIAVTVNGDATVEPDETVLLNLSSPTNAVIGDAQGVATLTNDDASSSLSINDVSLTEGNSGTKTATFTVTLAPTSTQSVTVAYATANGTATSGSDYVAKTGTLTFAAGVTTQTIAVTVTGDTAVESDETVLVNLTSPTNATIGDAQGIATLTNDDATPSVLTINDVSLTEGNSGTKPATLTVTLAPASTQAVTVAYATANGTATAGSDYVAASGTLTFAAGVTTQTIAVTVTGDTAVEADETVLVNLSSPTNATIGDAQGVATLTNDDATPSVLTINDVSLTEGNSGTKTATLTVTLAPASTQAVTVAYATANGTATAGSDYVAASGTLTFAAGVTTQTIAVTVTGDTAVEADETVLVNLTSPTNATIGDAQGVATLTNDDVPALTISDVSLTEGNSGTKTATLTVTLAPASAQSVTVAYATANGTATAGSDYTTASGTLTFAAGVTTQTVVVTVTGDTAVEADETVLVNLTSPTNATIGDAQGVATLTNDDMPALTINDVSLTEGNSGTKTATLTVTLAPASTQAVTVAYATANGTATAGSDYTTATGTLTFAAGVTTQTIVVTITGDTAVEADETVLVNLTSPTNATIGDAQGIATLTNDDATPSVLTINDVSLTEGNSGTKTATLTVTLTPASAQAVTVAYATANGTATAGSDYTTTSGTLTFAAGVTTQTIAVTVTGDTAVEPDETVLVNLTSPTNATIGDAQGVATLTNDDATPSVLTINDVSLTEGNSGTKPATLTVTLTPASAQAVTVAYATANGTATAGSDYTTATGTLTFAAGVTTQTVVVTVTGDTAVEPDETVLVNLTSPTNATIGDAQGIATLTNDDATPSVLTINDVSLTEGNSGTKPATLTVTLTPASAQAVTVAYAMANGTATAGSDYTSTSGTLTFAAGVTTQTIAVTVTGDTAVEADETVLVNLSSPTNATIGDAQGVATLTNDDATPSVLTINDVSLTEGNSGTKTATLTVTLAPASTQAVTVAYATANGTATAGSDYVAASGTLTFAAGVTTQTIAVTVTGDTAVEADETVLVNLTSPTNATIGDAQGIATLTNDDATPSVLTINDVSLTEGNSGTKPATLTVTLTPASAQAVTVAYAMANGTATAGSDYTSTSGTLTFAAGVTTQTIAVTVTGDTAVEPDETVLVNLSNPTNATIGDAQGVATLTNDDATPSVLAINDVTVAEGNSGSSFATLTVTLTPASAQAVTVAYATANGTATAGSDYTTTSGTLTFAAGVTTQTIAVTVTGDTAVEADETVLVNLTSPTNATIGDAQGIATLTNDDVVPSVLAINDVSLTEGNSGTKIATFTVTLAPASTQAVTVAYATANGTATAGSDYTTTSGTLTFAAGVTTQTIAVTVTGDTAVESDETVLVNLTSPTNATIGDAQGIATLTNDDATPSVLAINDVTVAEGNSGSSFATLTVTLTPASAQAVTVAYATANGTATAGSDYTTTSGTLTFAAGVTTQTIAVTVTGDTAVEADETVLVNLTSPTNATIGDAQGIATLTNDDATPSVLTINDVSLTEGNSGTKTATLTVTLTPASAQAVTVAYATANGTATAGSDYVAASGTLTFAAGVTTQTVVVTVTGDMAVEPDETVLVNLSSPTNATIGDAQGVATLTNDDATPAVLTINDVSLTEGNSGTKAATFTVTLAPASAQAVTVAYATANGTATAGSDYTTTSGTLTFAAGVTTQTIVVTVTGDTTVEADETVLVDLTSPTNATIGDAQGIGSITNDDSPSLSIDDVSLTEGNSGTKTATFTVTLTPTSPQTVTVAYATANVTATAGLDYLAKTGTLTFAPGVGSQVVLVTVTGDTSVETDETLALDLSGATNAVLTDAQGIATITNDDLPSLTINDVTLTEGDSGTKTATFTVTLAPASPQPVTVVYATSTGTAVPGSDYLTTSGTLTFAAGVATQTIGVTINGDTTAEPDETVLVNLASPTNALLGDAQGVATITNDDLPALTINDVSLAEGNSPTTATLTVTLTPASTQTVTVGYATANGTATAGSDYVAKTGTLTFAPGVTTQLILVTVSGDTTVESDETVLLNLSSPTNAVLGDGQGAVTITNDDVAPTPTVNVSATTVNPGAPIIVTVANGPANVLDWVALAPAGSPDTTYMSWKYLNDSIGAPSVGVSAATLTFTAPAAAGTYVFRFFENYTYAKLAQSVVVTVQTQPTLTINDLSLTEGNSGTKTATFTVTLAPASTQTVTVAYATADGTAAAGSDYVARTGTLTFAPGVTTQSIAITVNGDTTAEADEALVVNLSNASNADLGDSQGVGTLTNDDAAPSPSLGVSATTVSPGALIVVTVANGPGNQLDWVALAPSTAPDDSYLAWKYLNDSTGAPGFGVTNATLTFTAPAAPGTYVFRFFANYTFTKLAQSVVVTVQ